MPNGRISAVPAVELDDLEPPRILSEDQAVAYHRRAGATTCHYRGRWWFEFRPWFFTPVAHLDPVPLSDIGRPHWRALGYRAISADAAATAGRTPAMLVDDLGTYDADRLSRDRRREARRALETFDYRILDTPRVLLDQGWGVASRAARDSGHVLPRTRERYEQQVRAMLPGPGPVVVAAMDGERLVGYMTSLAVGTSVSLEHLFIAPEVRRAHAGVGLYWLTLRLWSRVAGVDTAFLGLTFPERAGLDPFKRTLGSDVAHVPSVTRLATPARWWLAATRQHAHRRQTLQADDQGHARERDHTYDQGHADARDHADDLPKSNNRRMGNGGDEPAPATPRRPLVLHS